MPGIFFSIEFRNLVSDMLNSFSSAFTTLLWDLKRVEFFGTFKVLIHENLVETNNKICNVSPAVVTLQTHSKNTFEANDSAQLVYLKTTENKSLVFLPTSTDIISVENILYEYLDIYNAHVKMLQYTR